MTLPTMPAYTCPQIDEALDRINKAIELMKKTPCGESHWCGQDEVIISAIKELEGIGASPSIKDLLETVRQANADLRELAGRAEGGKQFKALQEELSDAVDAKKDLENKVEDLEKQLKGLEGRVDEMEMEARE